eukprot:m.300574 g.300574  ORF g.300574 m.300574 type:complete len:196 (+) comp14496_c0_seq1:455-1042(+)
MASVNVNNVEVLSNPAPFGAVLQLEITFECLQELHDDIEWRLIYVGSARSEEYDQELECIAVGPLVKGVHKFVFESDPPDPTRIPPNELCGVTVILLTCQYRGQEFIRIGYYVNIDFADEALRENPPAQVHPDMLMRNILSSKPRVTRFPINWEDMPGEGIAPSDGVQQSMARQEMIMEASMSQAESLFNNPMAY